MATYGTYGQSGTVIGGGPSRLPLSSQFEAGRRGINDDFAAQQAQISAQMQQIDPRTKLLANRLQTHHAWDKRDTAENFSNRGMFNSGFHKVKQGNIDFDAQGRQNDLVLDAANEKSGLTSQMSDAARGRASSLQDLLLSVGGGQMQNLASLDNHGNMPYYSKGVY